jgi:polysaccharide pyruvyl transferase CsaB
VRIVISGYYGFSNAGDDAILLASIPMIRASHPNAQISIVTYPGADLAEVYRLTGLPAIDGADIAHTDQIIAAANLVLIGGGGLIQDYLPSDRTHILRHDHNNLTFWLSVAVMAHAHGVPVSTWMVGIGPLTTDEGRKDARLLLTSMRTVSVRDDESAALAEELGVEPDRIAVGADPVFTLRTPRSQSPGAPQVGVVVRNWEGVSAWLTPLAEALDRLVAERSTLIRLIPFQTGRGGHESDDLVAMRLAARMASADVDSLVGVGADPTELAKLIAGCDVVLGMRLHSLVFAAAAGVPTVALAYDPKVTQAMTRIGRADFVRPIHEPDAEWIYDRVIAALDEETGGDPVADLVGSVEEAASKVLTSVESMPELPSGLMPAMVASLAASAAETSHLSTQLASTLKEKDEQGHYLNDRVAELQAVRSEFQAFRDARAVKLAQLAWDGRRVATETLASVRHRVSSEDSQPRVEGELSIGEIVASNPDSAGFVVFAPSIHWDVELFQRPQQMALAFARAGHTVVYQVDEQYRNGLTGYRQVADGIYEGYLEVANYGELGAIPSPLFLSYVYNYAWGRNLTGAHTVYEHIDDLEVFEQVYGRHDLDRWHTDALHNADLVVGSAVDLMADLTPVRPDAVLVPNGVDVEHFSAEERPVPNEIAELVADGTPIIGYYGALAEWFDYRLLGGLAERLIDHAFVLIGPDYDGTLPRSGVTDLPNVHWLGPRPYASLPAYLSHFAVATIPFVVNDVTHSVSPLKLFEYMAGGKPVITPPLRECARYPEVLLADGVDEWIEMIELAIELGADRSFQQRMVAAAEANTWDARVQTILEVL